MTKIKKNEQKQINSFGKYDRWEILSETKKLKDEKTEEQILGSILKNRGIETKKEKEEFLNPVYPDNILISETGINPNEIKKFITRLQSAYDNKEKIIVYGDYDADGICSTAILWEILYYNGFNVTPYIPERFSEGYGINAESIKKIKKENPEIKLIITIDNGIVAFDAVKVTRELGIDVAILDHHQKGENYPIANYIIHTDRICGAGIAWFVAREIVKHFQFSTIKFQVDELLELAAIGTVADQVPLKGINRSIVKYGIAQINKTNRVGLNKLFDVSGIKTGNIGTYEINYMIAPRLNAMGRLEHAIESLRLLCSKKTTKAVELADILNSTNFKRQKIVDEVVSHARTIYKSLVDQKIIVLSDISYHEGVIGLAASKLQEEFYKPAIVISKGKLFSKASARSISGFNIIEAIRSLDDLIEGGGGHPMAAGFTIKTSKIEDFSAKIQKVAEKFLTKDMLLKKLRIDLEVDFTLLNISLANKILSLEPTGIGNPTPVLLTNHVRLVNCRGVGSNNKHLKLTFESGKKILDGIWFNYGNIIKDLEINGYYDIAFCLEENYWNGNSKLQLMIRDMRIAG